MYSHAAGGTVSQPDAARVSVSAFYTGANSQAVETSVTTLLEQAIKWRGRHALYEFHQRQ